MTTNCLAEAATIFSFKSAPPPPLIRLKPGIDLIGAVDGDIDHPAIVGIDQGDAVLLRRASPFPVTWTLRVASCRLDLFAQRDDHVLGRRTGAQADDHPVAHEVDGCERRGFLQAVEIRVVLMVVRAKSAPTTPRRGGRSAGSSRR